MSLANVTPISFVTSFAFARREGGNARDALLGTLLSPNPLIAGVLSGVVARNRGTAPPAIATAAISDPTTSGTIGGGGGATGGSTQDKPTLEAQAQEAAKRVTAATEVLAQSVARIRNGWTDVDTSMLVLGTAFGQLQAQVNAALERLRELGGLLEQLRDPATFLPTKLGLQNLSEDEKKKLKERLEALEEFLREAVESPNGSGSPHPPPASKLKP